MRLAKALKKKNRLISDIEHTEHLIDKYNNVIDDEERPFELGELHEELKKKKEDLIELKVKIRSASQPIAEKIHRIEELKSYLSFLKRLDTNEGKIHDRMRNTVSKQECYFSEVWKTRMMDETQDELENLQDEIEEYNQTTYIE